MSFQVVRSAMEKNAGVGKGLETEGSVGCLGCRQHSLRVCGEKGRVTWGSSPVAVPGPSLQEAPARAAPQSGTVHAVGLPNDKAALGSGGRVGVALGGEAGARSRRTEPAALCLLLWGAAAVACGQRPDPTHARQGATVCECPASVAGWGRGQGEGRSRTDGPMLGTTRRQVPGTQRRRKDS